MKVICIGRNYVKHIEELNNEVPTEPVVFMKPQTSLLKDNKDFYFPAFTKNIHYEAELVYRICNNGKHVKRKFTKDFYEEVTVGIDFTARDLQDLCKEKGLPWEKAKAFDHSAVIGKFVPLNSIENRDKEINFSLDKNDQTVQHGNSAHMMHSIDDIIVHVSQYYTLNIGDYIFTGTPAGVGPITIGDTFTGKIGDQELLRCSIK